MMKFGFGFFRPTTIRASLPQEWDKYREFLLEGKQEKLWEPVLQVDATFAPRRAKAHGRLKFQAAAGGTPYRMGHGGGRGIRTPVPLSRETVFKTAGFNHSPIPPVISLA